MVFTTLTASLTASWRRRGRRASPQIQPAITTATSSPADPEKPPAPSPSNNIASTTITTTSTSISSASSPTSRNRKKPTSASYSSSSSSAASTSSATTTTAAATRAPSAFADPLGVGRSKNHSQDLAPSCAAVEALLRPKAPSPSPASLCAALAALTEPLSRTLQASLAERVANDQALLAGLVDLAVQPPTPNPGEDLRPQQQQEQEAFPNSGISSAPRPRRRSTSPPSPPSAAATHPTAEEGLAQRAALHGTIAASLLTDGLRQLRVALVARKDLLRTLVFALDTRRPVVVRERVADLLRACVVVNPVRVAEALQYTPGSLKYLVANVPEAPAAAALLCRLVASKTLEAPDRTVVIPCDRRALRFVSPAQEILSAACVASSTPPSHQQAFVQTMSEMSSRAMMLVPKDEDPDEREDSRFVAGLNIITPAVYNDSRKALNLLESPLPIIAVLDHALGNAHNVLETQHSSFLPSVLNAISSVFHVVRDARRSAVPSVRRFSASLVTGPLAKALLERMPRLLDLLDLDRNPGHEARPFKSSLQPLGLLRLSIADIMIALMHVADSDVLEAALAKRLALHVLLLRLSQVVTPASQEVLLSRFSALTAFVLSDGESNGLVSMSSLLTSSSSSLQPPNGSFASAGSLWLAGGAFLRCLTASTVDPASPAIMVIARAVSTALTRPDVRDVVSQDDAVLFASKFAVDILNESSSDLTGLLYEYVPHVAQTSQDIGCDLFEEDCMTFVSEDDVHRMCLELQLEDVSHRSLGPSKSSPPAQDSSRGRRTSILGGALRRLAN